MKNPKLAENEVARISFEIGSATPPDPGCRTVSPHLRFPRSSHAAARPRPVLLAAIGVALAGGVGCGFDGVMEVQRPAAQVMDVTLILIADSLSDAAALLGWGGRIPGTEVTVQRVGLPVDPPPIRAETDAQGVVRLDGLETGGYRVTVERLFTVDEFEQVRETGVIGIAGSVAISVTGTAAEFELAPPAALRRPLVISEYAFQPFYRLGFGGTIFTAGFLELYNNSDTTIYLDGKLVGRGFDRVSTATPCDLSRPFREDPSGVWAYEVHKFPGNGQEYPVSPGQTVVIATDAIDHSQFVDELLDLSGADFEFSGPVGPDNPHVPNMVDVGVWRNGIGHGLIFTSLYGIPFVADPVDLASAPRGSLDPAAGPQMLRIPTDRVLDLAAFWTVYTSPTLDWCDPFVHPVLLRRAGRHLGGGEAWLVSPQRKVALRLPDGRTVLQDTRDSDVDFFVAAPTPGWIP
jgi:hypothetical protein